jgi:hypothetical protein
VIGVVGLFLGGTPEFGVVVYVDELAIATVSRSTSGKAVSIGTFA